MNKEPIRLTWLQWDEIFETGILDPDGFRGEGIDRLYSKQEFFDRLGDCTRLDCGWLNPFGV